MTDKEFGEALVQHVKVIQYVCNKYTRDRDKADDIVQDVLTKAWLNRANYDEKHKFSHWIGTLARNVYVDNYRANRLRTSIRKTAQLDVIQEPVAEYIRDTEFTATIIVDYIKTLKHGDMLIMIAEGMKYKDVAEELDIPLGTVKAITHRLREHLRERLGSVSY